MIGLGFSLAIRDGRPRLICASATEDAETNGTKVGVLLEHWADQGEEETLQLRNLAARVETLLVTTVGDAAVIRRMDWTGTVKRETVAKRGQAEGIVAAAVRARIATCHLASGAEVARLCGEAKAALEARMATLVGVEAKEAAAAALAALALASS